MNVLLRSCAAGLLLSVLGGCAGKAEQPALPDFTLRCAAVLPAVRGTDLDRQLTVAEEKALAEGVTALNQALREYFAGRTDIRLLHEEQSAAGGARRSLAGIKTAAEQTGCNAMLETTLHRYKERVGGDYTAKEPAAVSFSYRLLALPDGAALCRGTFDEEQEPLLNNLLHFRRSVENSFAWVKAERLLAQGLRAQLAACRYLEHN